MYWRRVLLAATLVFPRLGIAEVQLSQDWFWELGDGTVVYAATLNSQQRLLGQYCDLNDKSCMYLVTLGMSCTGDDEYPSILNSDAGVIEVTLICGHLIDNENVFYITPFDDVDRLVKRADNVGFAVAMKDGGFKVVRFSLLGSTRAISIMREGAKALSQGGGTEVKLRSEEYL